MTTELAVRQFLISNGAKALANSWLAEITRMIWDEEPLPQEAKEAFVVSLMALIQRGDASLFWNQGKKPHSRLAIQRDLKAFSTVEAIKTDQSITQAQALLDAAYQLDYVNDDSSDKQTDLALNRIANEYRRAKEKFDEFKQKLNSEALKVAAGELTPWSKT